MYWEAAPHAVLKTSDIVKKLKLDTIKQGWEMRWVEMNSGGIFRVCLCIMRVCH